MSMNQPAPFSFGGPAPDMTAASANPTQGASMTPPMAPPPPTEPAAPEIPGDAHEITNQHLERLINVILSKVAASVGQSQNIFQMATQIGPLVESVSQLHSCLYASKTHHLEASKPENDPRFEQQLALQQQKHDFAMDLMQQHFEEMKAKQEMELAQRKAEMEMQIAQQKAEHDKKMAQMDAAAKVQTIQQADEQHEQQKQQQEENHQQNLSMQDEMHEVQVEQAKKPQTGDSSEN